MNTNYNFKILFPLARLKFQIFNLSRLKTRQNKTKLYNTRFT